MSLQVIFRIELYGEWLDYCREPSPFDNLEATRPWAEAWVKRLEKREKHPFNYVVDVWP